MKNVTRFCLLSAMMMSLCGPAFAQDPEVPQLPPPAIPISTPTTPISTAATQPSGSFPQVSFGVQSFLQYAAELHESDGFNAFDVTRGYINIQAKLSDRVRARFTPDVRPTTDASLNQNLALSLEYASLEADITKGTTVIFGMHETPWLAFEESINRYRVQGPFFAERQGLIPGPTDVGVSIRKTGERTQFHAGVYNGEGYGRSEADKYKSIEGRATFRPFSDAGSGKNVSISGFYSYGWYANDRPRNVAIVMSSYEERHVVATAQYLQATDNPFVAADIERKGMSFFGEVRQGITGWAGVGRVDFFDPDGGNNTDSRRRYVMGGAHWSQWGQGRLGLVITLEQLFRTVNSEKLESRLLVQTHVQF